MGPLLSGRLDKRREWWLAGKGSCNWGSTNMHLQGGGNGTAAGADEPEAVIEELLRPEAQAQSAGA